MAVEQPKRLEQDGPRALLKELKELTYARCAVSAAVMQWLLLFSTRTGTKRRNKCRPHHSTHLEHIWYGASHLRVLAGRGIPGLARKRRRRARRRWVLGGVEFKDGRNYFDLN